MEIEYDPQKAKSNLKKHGISFEEAVTVLYNPMSLVQEDTDSVGENRWVIIGLSEQSNLITVIYTMRNEEVIRIISARKATRSEAKYYA